MDAEAFETELATDGYEPVRRDLAADLAIEEHDHAWDTKGLVLRGSFMIRCDGDERTYDAGQVFALPAGVRHTEATGPEGAALIVGRRMAGGGRK